MTTNQKYNIPKSFYRISIKLWIENENGEILMIRDANGVYSFLGGGLDFGETPLDCAIREVYEEAGLELLEMEAEPTYFVTFPKEVKGMNVHVAFLIYKAKVSDISNYKKSEECQYLSFEPISKFKSLKVGLGIKALLNSLGDFV